MDKAHLHCTNQPLCCLPQPASFISSFTSLFPLTFILKLQCPQKRILNLPQHMTISTYTAFHNQLIIHSFIPTLHQHKVVTSFLSLSCTSHIALIVDLSVHGKISISLSLWDHSSLPHRIFSFIPHSQLQTISCMNF